MKKIIIISLILMMTIGSISMVNRVDGAIGTFVLTDFEDIASGSDYGNTGYFLYDAVDDLGGQGITTTDKHNGTKSLYFDSNNGAIGYLNLTSTFSYISKLSFWFKYDIASGKLKMYFKNNSETCLKVELGVRAGEGDGLFVYDVGTDAFEEIGNVVSDEWYKIEIIHTSLNEFNYNLLDSTYASIASGTMSFSVSTTWTTFTQVWFKGEDGNPDANYYIDDMCINSGSGATAEDDPSGSYAYIGGNCGNYIDYNTNNNILEYKHHNKKTMTVKAFDIYVDLDIVTLSIFSGTPEVFKAGYELYINGIPCGNPDTLINNGEYQTIRWNDLTITLTDEYPIFEMITYFEASQYVISYSDCDLDGQTGHYEHDTITMFGNGVINGQKFNGDPVYRMYYEGLVIPSPDNPFNPNGEEGFNDTTGRQNGFAVDVYNYIGHSHPTYDVPYYYNYTNVAIGFTVGNLTNNYYVHVYRDDIEVGQSQKYEKLIRTYGGIFGYIPFNTGWYNATIETQTGTEIDRKTFYVANNVFDYNIYSIPNPSNENMKYSIGYWYKNGNDLDGLIACFRNTQEVTNIDNAIYKKDVQDGDNDIFEVYPPAIGNYYWQLYVNRSGIYLPVGNTHLHICLDVKQKLGQLYAFDLEPSIVEQVNAIYDKTNINENVLDAFMDDRIEPSVFQNANPNFADINTFFIATEHMFPLTNENTTLKLDGVHFEDVGQFNKWIYTHKEAQHGNHKLELVFKIKGVTYILDTIYFSIGDITDFGNIEIVQPSILPELDTTMGYVVGLILTMFMLLAPIIIAGLINSQTKTSISIPPLAYAMTGCIGVGFSTMMGWFPFWIVPFMVIVGVLILTIKYVMKNGSSSGE